jgi:mannose-6-phosphate isomerase
VKGGLKTIEVEKPWGRDFLPMPFHTPMGRKIGEIWFEPPSEVQELLVKYIFTSEKLSVQVHPSNEQLPGHGKEECWLILDAGPGAKLGIGFHEAIDPAAMRKAALDGSIVELMEWHTVRPGDFFYIPAGTVHAIGEGVSLVEIQQNSDVTYRLYDYGRPRELHLDKAVAVARGESYPRSLRQHVAASGSKQLVDGPLFRLDQIEGAPGEGLAALYGDRPLLVIPREGPVFVAGREITPGGCGMALGLGEVDVPKYAVTLIAQPCAS